MVIIRFFFFLSFICNFGSPLFAQSSFKIAKYQNELLQMVNKQRAKGCRCGSIYYPSTNPLKWNKTIEEATQIQANYISKKKSLTHRGEDGKDIRSRYAKVDYKWQAYAENIAEGYELAQDVFKAWIESPGHCKNIMGKYTEMAVVKSDEYWVLDFASPK